MRHSVFALGLCLTVVLLVQPEPARAQIYDPYHRPDDVEYREFATRHFRMIYQAGLAAEARELADVLERSLPDVRAFVELRRPLRMPVVLNRFSDLGNGFVTPLPFRQEIESVRHRGNVLSPRFVSWYETIGTHELVHAAHAESGRGFGIGWMLRRLGPDLGRSLNLSGPAGINEGAAVWYESTVRPGAGRLNHSLFAMEFRAAMLSEDPWNLTQMLEPPSYTRPFDRFYHGGAYLFAYMAEREASDFFARAQNFYYRFPLLGYGPALWYGTRMMPHVLSRRLRSHYRAEAERFVRELGELTRPEAIASERGGVFRRPRWESDTTLIAYAKGYNRTPGFYRIHLPSGKVEVVSHEAITEDFQYSLTPDRSGILFSRYVPDTFAPIRSIAEAFRLDLRTGRTERLTRGGRVFGAVRTPEGTIWALRNATQFNVWSWIDEDGAVHDLVEPGRSYLLSAEPSPRGDHAAVLLERDGYREIYRAVSDETTMRMEPWIGFSDGSIYDVSWSSDGRYLFFSADPGGVANVYVWDLEQGRLLRLTNVAFGALEPALSPDGENLAFVNYRHERYELVRIPFDPANAEIVEAEGRASVAGTSPSPAVARMADTGSERYAALRSVRPRIGYPFIVYQRPAIDEDDMSLGFGAGFGIEWSDPLQYWVAQTSAFYQMRRVWGRVLMRSGRTPLQPSLEFFRDPTTVAVRLSDAGGNVDTVRVGREERGVAVGVRTPVILRSNVFDSFMILSLFGEYRQEGLFGREGETIAPLEKRFTVRPGAILVYGAQRNPRDLVLNSGVSTAVTSKLDVWSERGNPARWVLVRSDLYLPVLRRWNTGLRLSGSALAQNRGGIVDVRLFFPRGYETATQFLGGGLFAKGGFEVTQPLWYIDDGFFLFPLYFRALFGYAFAETLVQIDAPVAFDRRTVAGGGLGLQLRFAHRVDFTLRFGYAYRFLERDWNATFR